MPSAEIITIGTELLLGEIQDTNTRYLTRHLRDIGVEIYRTTTVGDNTDRIASLIREAFTRAEIIITTGGLGPTVDDPTRDAVALAFNVQSNFHPELWQTIEARFLQRNVIASANNRKQAYLPDGATVINNPVGTAPAFYYEFENKLLVSLPGVPREMETLTESDVIPLLKNKYHLHGIIKARVLHIAGVGESVVDEAIGDLETLTNPTVGLLAHPGIVDARITAKADSVEEADAMISKIEEKIRAAFSREIYGADDSTLAQSIALQAREQHKTVKIFCTSLQGLWPAELASNSGESLQLIEKPLSPSETEKLKTDSQSLIVEVKYYQEGMECHLEYSINSGQRLIQEHAIYNGPPAHGPTWAINRVLEFIRRSLIQN